MQTSASRYWSQANYRGAAHLTSGRAARCGTPMGYGLMSAAHDTTRKCSRCTTLAAKDAAKAAAEAGA